ncbi:MAG: putative motility protein [Lachnospiraceae bacterium]|nr:putative motility protein [Lachnospiraceae bacterium]
MDISGLSVSMSTSSINTGLEIAMLSKVLDSAEIAGEALNEMMEAVAIPGLGENLDIRV